MIVGSPDFARTLRLSFAGFSTADCAAYFANPTKYDFEASIYWKRLVKIELVSEGLGWKFYL